MNATFICIAAMLLGIDYGYRPLPDGGVEYIIQIPPHLLGELRDEAVLQSDVPSEVKDIRAHRIQIGTGPLPRKLPPKDGRSKGLLDPPERGPMLLPDVASGRIAEQKAAYLEAKRPPADREEPKKEQSQQATSEESPRPWTLLVIVQLFLFASLGGNIYLGWMLWDVRKRRNAESQFHKSPLPLADGWSD
jgi:hypothetical protein